MKRKSQNKNIEEGIIITKMKPLQESFYTRKNVVEIAKNLLGKILVTNFNGIITAGKIVETEAYNGVEDKASHAYNGRRTARTEIMYNQGGVAYVYLCYGIHHLFNVVTNAENVPHAILIRALEPLIGIQEMLKRVSKKELDYSLTRGPGNVAKAMGIHTKYSGINLSGNEIFIVDCGEKVNRKMMVASARIGVDYAGADALLLYRFFIKDNLYVSGKK